MLADVEASSERQWLLTCEGLTLRHGERTLVENLSFELQEGTTLLLKGGNAAGKTAFARALRRELAADWTLAGDLHFRGQSVLALEHGAYRRSFLQRLAFVDENAQAKLFPGERVRQLFRLHAGRVAGAEELLADVGFAAPAVILGRRFGELSKGARSAIALAVALAKKPCVLVLDDVVHEMDALSADRCQSTIRRIQQHDGLAVLGLCRSDESHAALLPRATLELSPARPLPSPSATAFSELSEQAAPITRARSRAMVHVEHLTTLRTRDVGWLSKPETVFGLQSLSFDLWRGELLAIVGASPSGKTTLALTLARLLEPSLGHVSVRSKMREVTPAASTRRIVLCFEDARSSFDPRLSMRQQLAEVAALKPGDMADERRIDLALRSVGLLPELLDRPRSDLSSGEVELLALARALLLNPAVLVLDDALGHVEQARRLDLLQQLKLQRANAQLSTLIFTHQLTALPTYSDRVGVMYAGTLVELGPSQEVLESTYHPYTRLLFGMRQKGQRRLQLIAEGGTPDQSLLPKGCPFHPRCPNAEPGRCDREPPSLSPIAKTGEHLVACWHPHV